MIDNIRFGGNYTRPIPYSYPVQYAAVLAHEVIGIYSTHQEAEERIRRAFEGKELIHIDARND